jgi:hypothetical protein
MLIVTQDGKSVRIPPQPFSDENFLQLAGATLDDAACRRLFDLPATAGAPRTPPASTHTALLETHERQRRTLLEELSARNGRWFDVEMDKLDRWADDRRALLKADLEDLDESLKVAKRDARLAPNLPEKLARQRDVRLLEGKRDQAWRDYDQASREVDRQKETLLDEIGRRLEQRSDLTALFTVRWRLS